MTPPLPADPGEVPTILVPEIRDYLRINAELINLLDQGYSEIRLEGAEGQRLLVSGLTGPWRAKISVTGRAGPEFCANIDAPGLTVEIHGSVGDGAGSGMRAGRVLIRGLAGDSTAYAQAGGLLVAAGSVGHRAGLRQSGGTLLILGGEAGRLTGELQSGGRIYVYDCQMGPHASRGQRGGLLMVCHGDFGNLDLEDRDHLRQGMAGVAGMGPFPIPDFE